MHLKRISRYTNAHKIKKRIMATLKTFEVAMAMRNKDVMFDIHFFGQIWGMGNPIFPEDPAVHQIFYPYTLQCDIFQARVHIFFSFFLSIKTIFWFLAWRCGVKLKLVPVSPVERWRRFGTFSFLIFSRSLHKLVSS